MGNKDISVTDPAALLDFTHVNDLVRGIRLAEEHGVAGEAYNLTYGRARSLGEAACIVQKIVGGLGQIHTMDKVVDEPQRGSLDISKARESLGYRPKIDIASGIRDYVKWMRNYEHLYRE
jgi:nucleoside-diphosphate-sugar epimerase